MLGDQRPELADDLALMPERELGLEAELDRCKAKLLETRALVPGERLRELRQRRASPEGERVTQPHGRALRIVLLERSATVGDCALEPGEVELVLVHLDRVTRLPCVHSRLGQRLAQLRDLDLHHLVGGLGHVLAPERVDELVARDRAVRAQEQDRQESPLLPGRDSHRHVVVENL
jgi:hypothetical protein